MQILSASYWAVYMIPLFRDATKRGIVLMYWKLKYKVAVHALAKLFRSEYFKVI